MVPLFEKLAFKNLKSAGRRLIESPFAKDAPPPKRGSAGQEKYNILLNTIEVSLKNCVTDLKGSVVKRAVRRIECVL